MTAGIETNTLLKTIGHHLPIEKPLVSVIQTAKQPVALSQVIGVANANLAIRQQSDGKIVFTSGAEDLSPSLQEKNGIPSVMPPTFLISELIDRVTSVLPLIKNAPIYNLWGGLLDLTPDSLPILDQVPDIENLFIATGFSGHGFGIAPVVGQIISDLVIGKEPKFKLKPFKFDRFKKSVSIRKKKQLLLHG